MAMQTPPNPATSQSRDMHPALMLLLLPFVLLWRGITFLFDLLGCLVLIAVIGIPLVLFLGPIGIAILVAALIIGAAIRRSKS